MAESTYLRRFLARCLRSAFSCYVSQRSESGHLEVERKFSISEDEAAGLPSKLKELGFVADSVVDMTDTFLPVAIEGELMRIRRESVQGTRPTYVLTFKQWTEQNGSKERKETERQCRSTIAALWVVAGRFTKGEELLSYSKQRDLYIGEIGGNRAVVSVDQVTGLGDYSGHYMEVEVLVPLGADTINIRHGIFALVKQLLGEARNDVKQSYFEMLVKSRMTSS